MNKEIELNLCYEAFERWWDEYLYQGGRTHFNINANKESCFAAWKEAKTEADKLREALKFYADAFNWQEWEGSTPVAHCDEGDIAKAALQHNETAK